MLHLAPFLLLASVPLAQGERLSGPMVGGTLGNVLSARLAGDSGRVVYLADARQDEFSELWTVPKDASAPARRLHGHLESEVMAFQLTPDGTHTVYRTRELFVVPSDGSRPPRRLSAPLALEGGVGLDFEGERDFWIDPTGTRVAYLADTTVNDFLELFVVPLDGSAAAVRLGAAGMGEAEWGFGEGLAFTPDGNRVVFQTVGGVGQRELWSAPSDGSATPTRLTVANPGSSGVVDFRIALDGATVVFRATKDATGYASLFRVPVAGGSTPTLLHPPLVSSQRIESFAVGVGDRVTFTANLVQGAYRELYSVPLDASEAPRRLSTGILHVESFELVPGRKLAVFDAMGQLFVVPLDRSTAPVQLSAGPEPAWIAAFTPDGSRLIYFSGSIHAVVNLFSVPLDGPATAVKLSNPAPAAQDQVFTAQVFARGNRVAFGTKNGLAGPFTELWTAPVDGGAQPTRLATSPTFVGYIDAPAELDELVFLWRSPSIGDELFWTNGTGGAPPLKLNGPLTGGPAGEVQRFLACPDDRWVVYRADQEVDGRHELFSVHLRTRSIHKLNGELAGNLTRERFQITPDARRVVYQADEDVAGRIELYSAPIDGSEPAVALAPGMASDPEGSMRGEDFLVTPGSARVVFTKTGRLWSAPVDGSAPPLQLDTSLNTVLTGNRAPRVTSTPERVVYSTGTGSTQLLKVVPADGSVAPITLQTGGRVERFEPTADGTACLYLQRASAAAAAELFVVELDASATSLKLSHPLTAPNTVLDFVQDSSRVAYLAADPSPRLWITARDGSVTPYEASAVGTLHGALRAGSVQFADGGRILYLADSLAGPYRELWSVPLDGSAPPVRLNGANGSSNVESYRLAPGLGRVLYRAATNVMGLWSAPTDGSAAPVLLSHRNITVEYDEYSVSADGWVAYAQFLDGTKHVFLVPIDASRERRQVTGSDIRGAGGPVAFAGNRLLYTAVELPWWSHPALFGTWTGKAPRSR